MKSYAFFFHYNKPATLAAGECLMSVHYRGQCMIAPRVVCAVPCSSKVRTRQPRCVMHGYAKRVRNLQGTIVIDNPR
jgi:hypothetical protein